MKDAGFTMDELKNQIAENIKYTKYVDKEIKTEKVTDDEVKKMYEQYASQNGQDSRKTHQNWKRLSLRSNHHLNSKRNKNSL